MMKFFVLAASVSATLKIDSPAASLSIADLHEGANSATTIKFTTSGEVLPASTNIVITYPEGFGVSTTPSVTATGITLKNTPVVGNLTDRTVTITTSNAAQGAQGPITLVVTGITNPTTLDATGTFGLKVSTLSVTLDAVKISVTGTLADGETCEVAKQLLLVKADKCIPKSTCPAGTLKCTPAKEGVTGTLANGETCTIADQEKSVANLKCLPKSTCPAGTLKCIITGTLANGETCTIADQEKSVANLKCLPKSTCPAGTLKCITNGAFAYGFTMLAVLAAFVL